MVVNLHDNWLIPMWLLRLLIHHFSLILSRIAWMDKVMSDEIMSLKRVAEYLELAAQIQVDW